MAWQHWHSRFTLFTSSVKLFINLIYWNSFNIMWASSIPATRKFRRSFKVSTWTTWMWEARLCVHVERRDVLVEVICIPSKQNHTLKSWKDSHKDDILEFHHCVIKIHLPDSWSRTVSTIQIPRAIQWTSMGVYRHHNNHCWPMHCCPQQTQPAWFPRWFCLHRQSGYQDNVSVNP